MAMQCVLQTKNYGVESYDIGTGFGHFALRVPDVYETVKGIKEGGEPEGSRHARQFVMHMICQALASATPDCGSL